MGHGVKQDHTETVKWYRLAADQGNAFAQSNLGTCYDWGNGVTEDYREAVKWYRLAADQGDDAARRKLAYCYGECNKIKAVFLALVHWTRWHGASPCVLFLICAIVAGFAIYGAYKLAFFFAVAAVCCVKFKQLSAFLQ